MTNGHARRRFLGIAGAGAAASLAGCTALGDLTRDESEADDLLTVMVGPDEDEIDALIEEVQSGETEPAEARRRRRELLEEAVSAFRQRAEEEDALSIEDETPELGLFRVDTDDDGLLVELLREGQISSIHAGGAYDQILERQRRQQQAPSQAPPAEGAPGDAGNESDGGAAEPDSAADGTEDGTGNESGAE